MLSGLNTSDAQALRQCLRDVVALSTLPAIWFGAEPLRIAESLAASVFTTLSPEFVYISFLGDADTPTVAVAQTGRYESSPALASRLGSDFLDWARAHDPDELLLLPNPLGTGTLRVATRPVGHHAELGVIAVAFSRESSPTPADQLVLSVCATQAATAIQNAHLLHSLLKSEDRVRRANSELAERLAELDSIAIEKARLVEDLREADRRKDEFLATLAHELRNPLAPIRNMLELIKHAGDSGDLVEQARATMERQLAHMIRLIDDLLDVSRISRGKIELKRQRVELAAVVNQAIETCRSLAECAQHQITVNLPPEPIYLDGDPVRLAQILGNLLSNSCKYTEPGGNVWLAAERHGSDVAVKVKDTGVGIPADKLGVIFEMFTQVDNSLERAQGGLGIGLMLVKRLAEMHGGTVSAHSEGLGRGSEFVVRLPILVEQPTAEQKPNPNVQQSTTRHRILVADDNEDSAMSLAMLLEIGGHEVRTAHDGLEAVEVAAEFRPDIVLMDLGMPKLNGYDATRRIREQQWGERMVLIAVTGWGQEEDRRRTAEAGFNGHLVKPVDYDAVLRLLASLPTRERHQPTEC